MSGSRNSLADMGTFGAFATGVRLASDERDRDMRFIESKRGYADEEALRAATPGILGGDQDATQQAMAIDPQRVARVQTVQQAGVDRQRGEQEVALQRLGRGVTSLLAIEESQWPTVYPRIRQDLAQFGFNLPETVPSRDQVMSIGAALRTPAQNMADDADRPRLGAPIGGGAAPAAAGPFTPPAGDELDFMARMIHMESNGQGEQGMAAVGHTILNRARLSGRPVRDIITAPSQFEPWGNPQTRQQMMNMTPEQYAAARRVAEEVVAGRLPDPTEGATHFLNPDLQRRLGRSQPAWAPEGQGQRIGAHVFYRIPQDFRRAGGPAQGNAQPAAAEGGIPPGARQALDRDGLPVVRNGNEIFVLGDGPNRQVFQRPVQRQAPQGDRVLRPGDRLVGPAGQELARNDTATAATRGPQFTNDIRRLDSEDIRAIQGTARVDDMVNRQVKVIDDGLRLDAPQGLVDRGLNAVGLSTEQSRNRAVLMSAMESLRNEVLMLHNGVQTEGDAQRAFATLFQGINDTQLVKRQLEEIQRINRRMLAERQMAINLRRQEAGLPGFNPDSVIPSQEQLGARQQRGGQQQSQPAAEQPAQPPRITSDEDFAALPSGATFIDPEGRTRRKP